MQYKVRRQTLFQIRIFTVGWWAVSVKYNWPWHVHFLDQCIISSPSFIYLLTMGIVGAPQMTSQPVSSIFLCFPLTSGTWRTPGLSIPWCLPTSFSVCGMCSSPSHFALQDGLARPDGWETCPYIWKGQAEICLLKCKHKFYLPFSCDCQTFNPWAGPL